MTNKPQKNDAHNKLAPMTPLTPTPAAHAARPQTGVAAVPLSAPALIRTLARALDVIALQELDPDKQAHWRMGAMVLHGLADVWPLLLLRGLGRLWPLRWTTAPPAPQEPVRPALWRDRARR